jgi:DNA-binding transcriptional LysR family regulator
MTDWLSPLTRDTFDWAALQAFRTVAHSGAFRAAALTSGLSINTLRARVGYLEQVAGRTLFDRSILGTVVTPDGKALLARLDTMAAALAGDLPQEPHGERIADVAH